MKNFLMTLMIFMTLATSVSAQDMTVKKTEFSWRDEMDGFKGSKLVGRIGYEAGLVGDVTADISLSRQFNFRNHSGLRMQVEIVFDWTYWTGSEYKTNKDNVLECPMLEPNGYWTSSKLPASCCTVRIKSMRVTNWKR